MADIDSSLVWEDSSSSWVYNSSQISTATDNLGIPTYPYVKKLYISLEKLRDLTTSLSSSNDKQETLKNFINTNSKYVRIALGEDLEIPNIDDVAGSLLSKITTNWYNSLQYTEYTSLTPSLQGDLTNVSSVFTDKNPYLLRTSSTEHLSLEGWLYLRDSSIVNEKYDTYEEAKKIKDSVDHVLQLMTKSSTNNSFLPLSAGVASISPRRELNLANSQKAVGLLAGDSFTLSISGGSGEYSISVPNGVTLVTNRKYRITSNSNSTYVINVTDENISNQKVSITIETVEK